LSGGWTAWFYRLLLASSIGTVVAVVLNTPSHDRTNIVEHLASSGGQFPKAQQNAAGAGTLAYFGTESAGVRGAGPSQGRRPTPPCLDAAQGIVASGQVTHAVAGGASGKGDACALLAKNPR